MLWDSFFIVVFIVLRQGLTIWPWQSWNSLCKPSWPQAHKDPTAIASQVLELRHVPPEWLHCYFFLTVYGEVCSDQYFRKYNNSELQLLSCSMWSLSLAH